MKKQLLILSCSLLLFIAAKAQQSYANTFFIDSGIDGFTLGSINNQNGWETLTTNSELFTGCTIVQDAPLSLTSGFSYTAPGALSVGIDPNLTASQNGATFGCFSPSLTNEPVATQYANMAISILIDADDNLQTIGSQYEIVMEDNGNIASKVGYFPDGTIKVMDIVDESEVYVNTNFTWADQEWTQLTIEYNFANQTIKYMINGIQIYQGATLSGLTLERFAILHNNVPGSIAYFDDLFIFTSDVAGTTKFNSKKITIYPNPVNDIVNISNPENILLINANIANVDGRQIKLLPLNTTANTQVNIEDLPVGIYILTLNSINGSSSQKIIVY